MQDGAEDVQEEADVRLRGLRDVGDVAVRGLVGEADVDPAVVLEEDQEGGRVYAWVGRRSEDTAYRRERAAAVLRKCGGTPLGEEPGRRRAHGRYSAPYLRDALLAAGAFAETLETATFWSRLPGLYTAVRDALTTTLTEAGTPPLVMCHISHVYESGASLYFTVVSAQGEDPVAHWTRAKHAANEAILAAGGTISHHHGVGTDHRDWYVREIGPLGTETLRAVKRRLDPEGVLNPGVLLPAD
ncbi:alkyldihydroxyacetonephosphate synthase [Streptomyces sp. di188]|nr:alkyldihydroxyacetonephosphate synthase [Streptomyces sp. di50b]SCD89682.1 alkyldihydroxyacetonephosphate synthase [Streptomyces sp. di188]